MHTTPRALLFSLVALATASSIVQSQSAARGPAATMQASVTILRTNTTVEFAAPVSASSSTVASGALRVRGSAACRLVARLRSDAPTAAAVRVAGRDGTWQALDAGGVVVGECTNGRGMDAAPVVEVDGRRVDAATAPIVLALEMDAGF